MKTVQLPKPASAYPAQPPARDWEHVYKRLPRAGPKELYKAFSFKINLVS